MSTAPGSKRKPGIAKKEGIRWREKRRKYDLISEDWGAPAPPVDKMYASTDIRLGEGAVTVEQEEHHSPLPMEQQIIIIRFH